MLDFEKEFEERLSKGLKIIEDYFEEHWGSDIHLKYAKGIFDIWAVGEAKRYECINTKGTYFKQMSKNEKTKALEFNDLLEQEFKDYAKELVKEYQKKYPIEESKKSARKSIEESNDFYFEVVFYKDVAKAKEYVKEIYNEFLKKYGYSKNDITWKLTSKGIGFSSSSENIGFDLEDYILDHMYEYGDYEFETDYELMESKKSVRKSIKENKHNFSVYDFIDYMIKMKCIDDVMDYIDFDITQKEFDNALEDLGYNFKIIKKENPHDSIDGIKYYIYQYQIDDEIYRIWVDETGFVLDACLKY